MRWISLPVKVALLMILATGLVSAAGYLTWKSLSSIVSSVEVKSRPDLRLLIIRDIAADLDRAENSVRLYRITHERKDIQPYYRIISGIDGKIDSLILSSSGDTAFLTQIDTISSLIEENVLVWNDMIDLYHSDSLETYIHSLTAKIAVQSLDKKKPGILKRVFSRKALKEEEQRLKVEEQKALLSDIDKIRKQDSIRNKVMTEMLATESKLALTNEEIRDRLYLLITRMENQVVNSIRANARAAQKLADDTYNRLIAFAVLGAILVLTVIIVVIRYVLKFREYQLALERSREETEKLARTREMFVASMSHEIRTPVNAIHGFAEQLLHEVQSDESRKMVEIVHSASGHLVRVTNDVLDLSKLQNNAIVLERDHFRLLPLLEEVRLLFLPAAQKNNTTLLYSTGANMPDVLYGDSYRLKQILINLTGNAVKFTSNGEVRFSAEGRKFSGNAFELILTVQDNGIGIPENMKDKIFDEFAQAEAGITRKYGGTGLGLSIVKNLIELHKGTIRVDSTEGKGTVFTCYMPYEPGDVKMFKEPLSGMLVPQAVKNLKVLVVDDEEYNRLLFRTIFKRWGTVCDEVPDGRQAMEKIKKSAYNLVFMDARMPGFNGLEAASYIRNELQINSLKMPVIGTSASHSEGDMQLYLSAGMNGFLPKPFTEHMLLTCILSALGINRESTGNELNGALHEVNPVQPDRENQGVNLKNLYHIAGNDVAFVKQMLNSFLQTTEQGLNGLDESIRAGDLKSAHEIAHRISSPCRHVGASKLYSNLKMIEEHSKSPENMGILADLSKDSRSEFQIVKTGIRQHLEII